MSKTIKFKCECCGKNTRKRHARHVFMLENKPVDILKYKFVVSCSECSKKLQAQNGFVVFVHNTEYTKEQFEIDKRSELEAFAKSRGMK